MTDAAAAGRAQVNDGVQRRFRAVFCWTEAPSYLAPCWRALAKRGNVDLHVVHLEQLETTRNPFLDEPRFLEGISNTAFRSDTKDVDDWLLNEVAAHRPDVVVVCGWLFRPYVRLISRAPLRNVPVVLGMDSPWRGSISQRLARVRLSALISRATAVVTAGERSAEYARRLGVKESRIRGGYYGFDYEHFSSVARLRPPDSSLWPRRFLFVGRYVPQKDLATLIQAYTIYRHSVRQPWALTCCGAGPDARLLQGVPGVTDVGFTQPKDLASVFGQHGAFVLPSRFEPWGVVIAEATASGLPVICTTACGAGVDLVRPYYNGVIVAPQDPYGLARAMMWIHDHEAELTQIGGRGRALSDAYSADAWAERWHNYLLDAVEDAPTRELAQMHSPS